MKKFNKLLLSKWGDCEVWLKDGNVYMLTISSDSDTDSPRQGGNFGTFLTWCRNYSSPDENPFSDTEDFESQITEQCSIILPVYKYEHGSVAYNTTGFQCQWDSGQVGWIYCSKEAAIKEFGKKYLTKEVRKKALACMASEVEYYGAWANGQCYSYTVETAPLEDILGYYISLDAFNSLSDKEKKEFWHEWINPKIMQQWKFTTHVGGFIETEYGTDMYCYQQAMETF